ncbi:hypothetical protein G9A89_009250 [Geosiphon pyriformis]|nr:hypothetical protein G9A89_009250 [Geosiphon pyriformis]
MGGLKSKIVALEVLVNSILEKLDCLCSDLGNLVSIVTKTKLQSNIKLWIMNKFDGIWIFTSGLDLLVKSTIFENVKDLGDLDTLWKVLEETIVQAATKVFSKKHGRIDEKMVNASKNV